MNSSGPDLVRLHVFLHVGLLSEGTAAHDTLKGLFTRVTVYLNVGQCLCSLCMGFHIFYFTPKLFIVYILRSPAPQKSHI